MSMFVCFFLKNLLCSNTIIWDLAMLRLSNCLKLVLSMWFEIKRTSSIFNVAFCWMQVLDVLKQSAFKLICYRKAMVFVIGN